MFIFRIKIYKNYGFIYGLVANGRKCLETFNLKFNRRMLFSMFERPVPFGNECCSNSYVRPLCIAINLE